MSREKKEGGVVPVLRFPGFEGDWELQPIGKSIDFLSGYSFKGDEISEVPGGIWILKATNIGEGEIKHSDNDKFYHGDASKLHKYKLVTKDLVIGMDGSKVGKNSALLPIQDQGALLIQRVARLRAKENRSIEFIFHHVNSSKFHRYVDAVKTGSSIAHISSRQIKNFKIAFPSLTEQRKIAEFLGLVDRRLALARRELALLEAFQEGLMQLLFSEEKVATWQEQPVSELFAFVRTNSLSRANLSEEGDILNIHYGDIHNGLPKNLDLSTTQLSYIDRSVGYEPRPEEYLRDGDLVIADASEDYADIGKCIEITNVGDRKVVAGLHTIVLRDKIPFAVGFKAYLFSSCVMRRRVMRIATGVSVLGIGKGNLGGVLVYYPYSQEQKLSAKYLTHFTEAIELVKESIAFEGLYKRSLISNIATCSKLDS